MSTAAARLDPKGAAEALFAAHKDERAWLDSFAEYLDRKRAGHALARVHEVWGLSQADSARLFGVSRANEFAGFRVRSIAAARVVSPRNFRRVFVYIPGTA